MKIIFISRADKEYRSLSTELQALARKQFSFLLTNIHHPSLRAKKYDEEGGVWQGRINRSYRFYFMIEGDTYCIIGITKHSK
jgi:mRNA-degrading endonuclease RelE of RelBE toxin-antitoxin system